VDSKKHQANWCFLYARDAGAAPALEDLEASVLLLY